MNMSKGGKQMTNITDKKTMSDIVFDIYDLDTFGTFQIKEFISVTD